MTSVVPTFGEALEIAQTFCSGVSWPSMEATKLSKWGTRPRFFSLSLIHKADPLSVSLPAMRLGNWSASVCTLSRAGWPSKDVGLSASGGTLVGLKAKNAVSASRTQTSQVTR